MTLYRCDVCNTFEYNSDEGIPDNSIMRATLPEKFPADWQCPICDSDASHLKPLLVTSDPETGERASIICPFCGYRTSSGPANPESGQPAPSSATWLRTGDSIEVYMDDIHEIARTGRSITEPMRTKKQVISWDDILIKGSQIARIPLEHTIPIDTRTIIGPSAKYPLVMETPIFVTHMSFGALSREVLIAIAKGTAAVKTAMCSGEGGILEDARAFAYRYIFEYVPNHYSITEENLRRADAIEIKLGQSTQPGLGARLPAEKVTEEIALIRGYPRGKDILGPATFEDIRNREDLREKVNWLRETSRGKPVGVKIAAGDIEKDLDEIIYAEPDFITIDGRPGASAAALKFIKCATSVPTIYALHRARSHLDRKGASDISLIITGGLRISPDFAKALALGADAVAIGTAALIACGCQQWRLCNTGKCPVGVTTQEPELRERCDVDLSARGLENFLRVSTSELKEFSRLTGCTSIHKMNASMLCTTNREISEFTNISHV